MSAITVGKTSLQQWAVRVGLSYYKVFKTRDEADAHAADLEGTTIAVPAVNYARALPKSSAYRIYALAMRDMQRGKYDLKFRLVRGHIFDAFRQTMTDRARECVQAMATNNPGNAGRPTNVVRETQRLTEARSDLERAATYGEAISGDTYAILCGIALAFGYPAATAPEDPQADEEEITPETVAEQAAKPPAARDIGLGRRRRSIRIEADCPDDEAPVE